MDDADWGVVALAAFLGIVALWVLGRRPRRLLSAGRGRLPRTLAVKDIPSDDIPSDAREPLEYLAKTLAGLGFREADLPARVPAVTNRAHRLIIVPFVHEEERAYFLMAIESGLDPRTELMLHVLSPLEDEGRVETTTLPALADLRPPEGVRAQIVLDAESVEEIWSRHRRALTEHPRDARMPTPAERWQEHAARAYDAWVTSAVRAQWLKLDASGETYRIRSRSA